MNLSRSEHFESFWKIVSKSERAQNDPLFFGESRLEAELLRAVFDGGLQLSLDLPGYEDPIDPQPIDLLKEIQEEQQPDATETRELNAS